jgi:succinate dehydrogenase / fumarate reductase, cytochrome b subunit
MHRLKAWISSSVGKKQIVGLSGLGIAGFTLGHMSGNLLMFISPKAYNAYGHSLVTNPLFPLIEAVLFLAFVTHIFFAIRLSIHNRSARPMGYTSFGSGLKRTSFAARSMILTGLLVLAFLVLHIATFKYGPYYSVVYDGVEMRDLYKLIFEKFQEPLYVAWYVFSLVVLGVHLNHGVSSLFQSLGLLSARTVFLRQLSWAFSLIVAGGFIAQPLWIYCCGGNVP